MMCANRYCNNYRRLRDNICENGGHAKFVEQGSKTVVEEARNEVVDNKYHIYVDETVYGLKRYRENGVLCGLTGNVYVKGEKIEEGLVAGTLPGQMGQQVLYTDIFMEDICKECLQWGHDGQLMYINKSWLPEMILKDYKPKHIHILY
jgi:hypothetical protein